ncbi:MAG: HAD-IA family hydrolase [Acidimicrobiales bacterium]
MIRAVLFDLGGVVLSSPFEAFARYEAERGLPDRFLRTLNATNPHDNAWARLERNAVGFDEFCDLFEAEARAAGGELNAREVFALLVGDVRPAMAEAVRRCRARMRTGALTNNWLLDGEGTGASASAGPMSQIKDLFHVVVESSRVGLRKPDPAIYHLACEELGVPPTETVFLDDLGQNLKPARQLGMTTIKVDDPDDAIADLESVVGFRLR